MRETKWVLDYSLEAPDGHVWLKPGPEDCPGCSCCTAALCQRAEEAHVGCEWLVKRGPGVANVSTCPCGEKSAIEGLRRAYRRATPEKRAEVYGWSTPERQALFDQFAAELERGDDR